ncbi:DUF1996 domain-containing protein [Iamia sp. SCSIO 61187]|uniref:DUF1996 domain-containing protein n=1 Tax=Iamia sp. SCSIO 61187 TaxID=2722752 RepID=UPI001C62DF37|nr:DUF1996 domain-containing protein [Iamia sp. SCSIO 61187]QYG92579.1 DUF1996 domain-containing protein [Iamia sp. SCSIO 61187]
MTRGAVVEAVVAAVVGILLTGCAGAGGSPPDGARPGAAPAAAEWVATDEGDALFTVDCPFSHRAADDPIVHPGHPGASHSHDFFGSEAVDASSTGASLRGTATTCVDPDDTASYWVPTLSIDGAPVEPTFLRAYYRAVPGSDVREVEAPPLGLAMIAGDPTAGGGHEHGTTDGARHHPWSPTGEAGWGCGLRPRRLRVEPPTDCTDASPLTLRLRFPDCWDGVRLDSEDHRAHVAPSVDGACPASHPVAMTQLQVSVVWPVTGAAAGRATLASGPVAGAHGDFLNGWDPDALADHVELCIRARANCTIG